VNAKKTAVAAAATAALLTGATLAIAPAAQAAPAATSVDPNTTSAVTPAVGVDFRDDHGNRTTSGISNRDQFEYLGVQREGKNGDGTLIKVRQLTNGRGGWGKLYTGWIPVKYTQLPSMFKQS
jgi:hypothetical protein